MIDFKIIASNVEEFLAEMPLAPEEELPPSERDSRSLAKCAAIVTNLEWVSHKSLVTRMRVITIFYTSD